MVRGSPYLNTDLTLPINTLNSGFSGSQKDPGEPDL